MKEAEEMENGSEGNVDPDRPQKKYKVRNEEHTKKKHDPVYLSNEERTKRKHDPVYVWCNTRELTQMSKNIDELGEKVKNMKVMLRTIMNMIGYPEEINQDGDQGFDDEVGENRENGYSPSDDILNFLCLPLGLCIIGGQSVVVDNLMTNGEYRLRICLY